MYLRIGSRIVIIVVFVLLCGNVLALCVDDTNKSDIIIKNTLQASSEALSTSLPPRGKHPLLAAKTNLLFDLASAINIEMEIPIENRWSVAGEWIFPWWLSERKQVCLQIVSGHIEGRYWFGDRQEKKALTGWFAGLYAGAGFYDLAWKTKGYQGKFFIAAGLSGGYAHTINKSRTLRMEYSLGVGYMQTKYRQYVPINSGEILSWQKNGRYSLLGPTRVKVSLAWMIHHRDKKGGVRQ